MNLRLKGFQWILLSVSAAVWCPALRASDSDSCFACIANGDRVKGVAVCMRPGYDPRDWFAKEFHATRDEVSYKEYPSAEMADVALHPEHDMAYFSQILYFVCGDHGGRYVSGVIARTRKDGSGGAAFFGFMRTKYGLAT